MYALLLESPLPELPPELLLVYRQLGQLSTEKSITLDVIRKAVSRDEANAVENLLNPSNDLQPDQATDQAAWSEIPASVRERISAVATKFATESASAAAAQAVAASSDMLAKTISATITETLRKEVGKLVNAALAGNGGNAGDSGASVADSQTGCTG